MKEKQLPHWFLDMQKPVERTPEQLKQLKLLEERYRKLIKKK